MEQIYHLPTLEKELITKALAKCDGNITHAAEMMGVERSWLSRKMDRYGMNREFRKQYDVKPKNKYGI